MSYQVRYSTLAYMEYEDILDYVFKHFGADTALKVDQHFEKVIDYIALNPLLFPLSERKTNLRRCVISPQTTLFYRFDGEHIELVSFRGNRLNPNTLNL
jgi:plasmid stabilization system protein ParE